MVKVKLVGGPYDGKLLDSSNFKIFGESLFKPENHEVLNIRDGSGPFAKYRLREIADHIAHYHYEEG